MIVKMKKICLVVQQAFSDIALYKLRDVGVVHLEKKDVPIDVNSGAHKRKAKVDDAISIIGDIKKSKDKKAKKKKKKGETEDSYSGIERRQKPIGLHRGRRVTDIYGTEEEEPFSLSAVRAPRRPELSEFLLNIDKERKLLVERDIFLSHEIERIEQWGNFDPSLITEMFDEGFPVYLYELVQSDYEKVLEDTDNDFIKLGSGKTVLILVFGKELKGFSQFKLPEKSLSEYKEESEIVRISLREFNERISGFSNRRPTLNKEMEKINTEIEFESASTCLEKVDFIDIPSDLSSASCALSWLTGFIPKDDVDKIKAIAKENSWALSIEDPSLEDNVPTKLKNNAFSGMLAPVSGFLGITPGYREVDISGWFLIFFCVFVSMIFADGGYGTLITLIALIGVIKTAKKGVPIALRLFFMLGVFIMTWGVLTCSWFGISPKTLPDFFTNISLAALSTAKTSLYIDDPLLVKAIVDQNKLLLCFTLGLLHLSIAHIIRIINMLRNPHPRMLAEFGSLGMLIGIYNVVLYLMVSKDDPNLIQIPIYPVALYALAGGFALSFVFGAYEKSVGQSILDGLKNIIGVVLGVTGVFSDIMSYIRLWAVALAGAAISETVNAMAGPILGSFLFFLAIVLLVFGHGLNMILTVLSVLVHGVRLNILEFSTHVKLTWVGIAYKPFKL